MTRTNTTKSAGHARKRRDDGMTLPEVLLSITLISLIMTVVAGLVTVVVGTIDSAEGRANVARAENSINNWLPRDLASTDVNRTDLPSVNLLPDAVVCTTTCGNITQRGSSAVQLAWETTLPGTPPTKQVTKVQYQYIDIDGDWKIQRIECVGSQTCTSSIMLHNLRAPADLAAYDPDVDSPTWVMNVTAPEDPTDLSLSETARRISITIDGGGEFEGAGGGLNTVNVTAGGLLTSELSPDDFIVPSFVRARSRCGGPVTLIVDDSGSIGSDVSVVEQGVEDFIEAFRGTPTQLQIIPFQTRARLLDAPSNAWHHYVDMTDFDAVDDLKDAVRPDLDSRGGTNWEDAFFRALREKDGTVSASSILPNRIVFFTDGVPTKTRNGGDRGGGGQKADFNAGEYTNNDYDYSPKPREGFRQEGWDRTDALLDRHRNIDLIFVGVGPGLTKDIDWIHNPDVYTDPSAPAGPTQVRKASETISHLVANGPSGHVPAVTDPITGAYTNPEVADFYSQENFNTTEFGKAMKAAALKDCGGTLTIQTRDEDTGDPIDEEFVYENSEYRTPDGTKITADARRVTTSDVFRTGTFDFEIPGATSHYEVDIVPSQLQTLQGYDFEGWSCRAGVDTKSPTVIDIDGSDFEGIAVEVAPNEAVSCVMEVSK